MMSGSMKHCKRELKSLTNSVNDPCSTYLKANYEYLRGNLQKAMRILNSHPPASRYCSHFLLKILFSFYFPLQKVNEGSGTDEIIQFRLPNIT